MYTPQIDAFRLGRKVGQTADIAERIVFTIKIL